MKSDGRVSGGRKEEEGGRKLLNACLRAVEVRYLSEVQ